MLVLVVFSKPDYIRCWADTWRWRSSTSRLAFPDELENVSRELGSASQQLALQEWRSGIQTDQPFIYQLLEACTRRKFRVYPESDVEPIAWMAAAGVSADDIARLVHAVYPELANP